MALPVLVFVAVLALVVAAGVRRRPAFLAAAGVWALFGVAVVVEPWVPLDTGEPEDGVVVAVANVFADNPRPEEAVAALLEVGADLLVVPEANDAIDELLRGAFPYAIERRSPPGQVGVYGRLPLVELPVAIDGYERNRIKRVAVGGREPFVLWALHLPRPWFSAGGTHQARPAGHARTLEGVLEVVADERRPTVLAGDLNLTDRGRGYRRATADHDDALRGIWGRRTSTKWLYRPLLLRIDHVLVPEDWCAGDARRFEISGSDHRGVAARVGPCRSVSR